MQLSYSAEQFSWAIQFSDITLDMDASLAYWALFLKDAFNKSQAKRSIYPALKNQNFPHFFHGIWEWKLPRCEWDHDSYLGTSPGHLLAK